MGIPTIAADIGANSRIIKSGENSFLVGTDNDCIESIERLIENKELRKKIGEAGIETVEKQFSKKANTPTYLKILRSHI